MVKLIAILQILNGGFIVAGNLYFLSVEPGALAPVVAFCAIAALAISAGLALYRHHRSALLLNGLLLAIWIFMVFAFASTQGISFDGGLDRVKSIYVVGVMILQLLATIFAFRGRSGRSL